MKKKKKKKKTYHKVVWLFGMYPAQFLMQDCAEYFFFLKHNVAPELRVQGITLKYSHRN